jgi:hypothetical protein
MIMYQYDVTVIVTGFDDDVSVSVIVTVIG